jgi:PKHD-type hydroxylase
MSSNKIIHYNNFLSKSTCIQIIDFVNNYMSSINYQYKPNLLNTILCEEINDTTILNILQKNIFQIGNIIRTVYDIKFKLFPCKAILIKYNNITNFDLNHIFNSCQYSNFASILYLNDDKDNIIDFFNSNCKFNISTGDIVCFRKTDKHKYKVHNSLSEKFLLFICYSDTELLNIFKQNFDILNIQYCNFFNLYIQPNIDLNKIIFESNFLNDLEIQYINDFNKSFNKSTITTNVINENIRKSKTAWLDDNKFNWLYNKIYDFVYETNKNNWNFQIFGAIDPIQYTEYNIGDFYDWHTDIGDNKMQYRKISIIICITDDYNGGEIIFFNSSKPIKYKLKKGDLIIFPSFILHKVAKIKKGIRKSLVMWICGNNFI